MICLSKNGTDPFINDFAYGIGVEPVTEVEYDNPEPIIFRSIAKKEMINYRLKHGLDFYYMDTGYFGNDKGPKNESGKKYWVRIVKNGLQHNEIIDRPMDRWAKHFNYPIKQQKPGTGHHILLVLPSEKPCKFYDLNLDQWTEQTINEIKKYTDRPIVIRAKARREVRLNNTIYEQLEKCHAMVTFQSIAAVESVMYGVPAFTLAPTAADPVCDKDLSKLETPTLYNKAILRKWVNHLAYCQFHVRELLNGDAWRILQANDSN